MISYDNIIEAQSTLVEYWGENGKNIIVACVHEKPFNDSFSQFLSHCYAQGGDWGGMILTGVRALYPTIWEMIPNRMGVGAWVCICNLLVLLGVDTSE